MKNLTIQHSSVSPPVLEGLAGASTDGVVLFDGGTYSLLLPVRTTTRVSPPVLGGVAAASADGVVLFDGYTSSERFKTTEINLRQNLPMPYVKNDPEYREFRTNLRNNLTPSEARLWNVLKGSRLDGRKFRRQYGVGKYVLDFYCPSEKLAVELDGSGHFSVADVHYDNIRRRFVEQFGIRIIRFDNVAVAKNLEWVVETIRSNFGVSRGDV